MITKKSTNIDKNEKNKFGYEFILVGFNRVTFPKEKTQLQDLTNSIKNIIRQNYGFDSFCFASSFEGKKWLSDCIRKSIKDDDTLKKYGIQDSDLWFAEEK